MNIPKYSLENQKIIYFFLAVMLIGGKIIVQEICTYRQCILAEDMGIEGTDGVLTVDIIVVMSTLIIPISSARIH